MKRKTKVIQVSGLRGIFLMIFIAACLAAGFIAFPAILAMHAWNYFANMIAFPVINIYQGLLLWAIIAISGFIINDRKKFLVAFKAPDRLSDEDMRKLMERVKMQAQAKALNSMILKSAKPVEKEDKVDDASENKKENV